MTNDLIPISDLARAQYEIATFLARRSEWIYRFDGRSPHRVSGEHLSVASAFGKLLFTLWGEDFSECWRIEAYAIRGECLRLRLGRRPADPTTILEIHGTESALEHEADARRCAFESTICRLIERQLGARIEYAATHRDDSRQLSGLYTRLILSWGGDRAIAIAVNSGEPQAHVDGLVTAGVIWWECATVSRWGRGARRLLLFAPARRAQTLARRLTVVRPEEPRIELYEVDEHRGTLTPVAPFDQGTLFDPRRVRLPRPAEELPPHPLRDRALALAPGVLRAYRRPGSAEESLRVRGLEIARLTRGTLRFGIGARKSVVQGNWDDFERFVREVVRIRHPESPEKAHPFYRLQAERWLEDMIREDVRRVDPRLDPRFLYAQIPAYEETTCGFVDLLGITEDRQLALIELKADEDVEAPMQAVDYWLRIEWHRRRGDLTRRGYFPGVEIADRPTLVFIVAPLLRFHRTFDLVASWIDRRVPHYKVGISDDWRKGVRVVLRRRANG
jgi:hypothetical protein